MSSAPTRPFSPTLLYWPGELIRVFRLMKLLRVLRGMRLFNRWEARLSINYTIFELVMLVMGLMLFAHWMACIFGVLMASELIIDVDDDIDRWATAFGGWLPNVHRDSSAVDKYAAALYWSMSMVMGFGSAPLLFGADEVFLYILGMVLCGVMNAYLIGGVVSMLERIKEHTSEFHRTMDTLNSFLVDRRVMDDKCVVIDDKAFSGQDICEKLRSYYIFKFKQGKMAENWQEDILRTCSQFMQSAVAYKMHARTLGAVPLFRPPREQNSENLNKYQRFITYISMHLETQVFSGHEVVFYEYDTCDCLYIVEKGSVFVKGRVCRYGDYFGERVFDTATSGRGHRVITLTDSVLLTINQQVLHEAMDSAQYRLPELKARIASAVMQAVRVCSRAARYTVHNQSNLSGGYGILCAEYPPHPSLLLVELWQCYVRSQLLNHRAQILRESFDRWRVSLKRDGSDQLEESLSKLRRKDKRQRQTRWLSHLSKDLIDGQPFARFRAASDAGSPLSPNRDRRHSFKTLLRRLDMEHYTEIFSEHKLESDMLAELSTYEISMATGIPLGDIVKIKRQLAETSHLVFIEGRHRTGTI
ncbi:hypothetical protein CYMTET_4865 [Cymbomonas tetramitiformis]|uniref:Cyclic nucleotide-binding domain-containing protein n=1 Tax=Cymbomonas tetramitiformis TaxID=36881 RepID=A0AAE0LJH5_9CHLO|nr:hypothetical protein CYMTET_4865 [Cymbomonas tetramitiformis]